MWNELAINTTESSGGHFIYEATGRFLFASSSCLQSLIGRGAVGITTLPPWIVYQHVTHWKRKEEEMGASFKWRCSCVRGTLMFCESRSGSACSLGLLRAGDGGCWAPSCSPCKAAPFLRSSQKEVINDAVLISSLRRGLKTEVAQWSDTISIPLSWAISGHSSLAGPCTKPYKPLLLLRVVFAVQPLHLHISHSHILFYIKTF